MYYQNLENFVIDDVLTEDEKTYVYEKIKEANERNSKKIVATLGHTTYFFDVSEDFKNKIIAKIQKYFNDELVITELSAAKYHNATGFVPKLHPHYDGFSESRVTFDIQLDSTIEWPIVVEGKEFTLKNGSELLGKIFNSWGYSKIKKGKRKTTKINGKNIDLSDYCCENTEDIEVYEYLKPKSKRETEKEVRILREGEDPLE